jgi:predicted RNase H-like HicB family nuclease
MEQHYHINIFWDARSDRWVAAVPDLPGCSAHGATPAEAAAEVQTAIQLWLETALAEGLPVPEARYRPPTSAKAA